jgi:hypothetical protein
VFGAGGAAGVQVGEFGEPLAFQAVHKPPQPQHPFGPDRVGQPVPHQNTSTTTTSGDNLL